MSKQKRKQGRKVQAKGRSSPAPGRGRSPSPTSQQSYIAVPPVGIYEAFIYILYSGFAYVILFYHPRTSPLGASGNTVMILIAVYTLVILLGVGIAANAARTFASGSRVWFFFVYEVHQIIIQSAAFYYLIGNGDPTSFRVSSATHALTPVEAIYFATTTFTTTGYGDISPVSSSARLLVAIQELIGFLLISLVLTFVLTRMTQRRKIARSKREQLAIKVASQVRGSASLHPGERAVTVTFMTVWIFLATSQIITHQGANYRQLSVLQQVLIIVGLLLPVLGAIRIIQAARDPYSANDRVKYLFVGTVTSFIYGYVYVYSLISYRYPAFSDLGQIHQLTPIKSFYFTVTTLTTTGFGDIVPQSDASRLLVCFQQVTVFFIFAVAITFAYSRWEPTLEAQEATYDKKNRVIWKRRTKGDI
jgi:voltage-gated potassium channel Kch